MTDEILKTTPLNAAHRALGARMVGFGGYDMPVQYEGVLAEHAFKLAQAFSRFYAACPILSAEPVLRSSRLALADTTLRQLEQALDLLGITAPARM